jgi:hypothetical protein
VKTDCSYRDETGGSGMLKLDVAAARVRAFEARANFRSTAPATSS